MNNFDVIARINELCKARSWTYYRLAKESGIPYSTLNTMLHKTYVPTVPSLMKLCDGFGISIAQFFSEHDETILLSKKQTDKIPWELPPPGDYSVYHRSFPRLTRYTDAASSAPSANCASGTLMAAEMIVNICRPPFSE